MKTFSEKTRVLAVAISNGYCQCSEECVEKGTQHHHMLPNTKLNQSKYPLFLHSVFNDCFVNHNCHMTKPLPSITYFAAACYEEALESYKKTVE